jgi:hypothetical protein
MSRTARVCASFFAVVAAAATLVVPASATAASDVRCEDAVINDWSDNGRIDSVYPLSCYQRAIEAMPADLRDYTNATDAIQRALTRAVNEEGPKRDDATQVAARVGGPQVGVTRSSSLPFPLVVLVAISLAVFAAGGLGHFSRRRRTRHDRLGA